MTKLTTLERDNKGRYKKGYTKTAWNKGKKIGGKPRGGGYEAIHIWLKNNHGKPNRCENKECAYKNPKRYEYALRKGFKHEHNRDNYIMLCVSCHRRMDDTPERREKIRQANLGKVMSEETKNRMSKSVRKTYQLKKQSNE